MNLDNKKENITDVAARLQAIIETAVDGIIAINDRGVIESVNPATCKIFDYEVEELLGQNVSMLMPQPHKHNHDTKPFETNELLKVIELRLAKSEKIKKSFDQSSSPDLNHFINEAKAVEALKDVRLMWKMGGFGF